MGGDGRCDPCPIKGEHTFKSVHDLVQHPEHRYVAAIGGDIHNYQRYPVRSDGRVIQYIVSGGGGAFMHDTHSIPRIDGVPGVEEKDFKCYPLRRDSLVAYSRLFDQKFGGRGRLSLTDDQAAVYLSENLPSHRYHLALSRGSRSDQVPQRFAADRLTNRSARSKFHVLISPFLDWDDPPFYKHFLRIEVSPNEVVVTCHGVTGCGEDEAQPCIEDVCHIPLPIGA